jgi:hypothetical protein
LFIPVAAKKLLATIQKNILRYFDEAPRNFLKKNFLRSNPTPYPASVPR